MLSETWLDNNIGNFDIKGYNCYNHYSSLNISDGISVYIKDSIIVNNIIIGSINHCSSLDFSISYNNILIKLTCIYRSPSLNKIDVIDNLEDFLNNYSKFQSHIICGDINLNIKIEDIICIKYLNVLSSYGFKSCINGTTRSFGNSNTCIDHIFIKNKQAFNHICGYIYQSAITDHYSTIAVLSTPRNNNNINTVDNNTDNHNYNFTNIDNLNNILKNINWTEILKSTDVNVAIDLFTTIIENSIKKSQETKIKKIPKNKKRLKNWITLGIINSMRHRDRLYAKLKNQPFNIKLQEIYKKYRNLLNVTIKIAKDVYFYKQISNVKGNTKKIWEFINEALDNKSNKTNFIPTILNRQNQIVTDNISIANEFNSFFVSIGTNISNKFKSHLNIRKFTFLNDIPVNDKSIFLNPISTDEIKKYI